MNPKVSVIMPIYNVEKYLQQSLLSVIHQTMRDIEIICINDGSTDSSGKILSYYSEKDDRIKIITTLNKGYGHAMNIGLREAKGEYIGIVEPDDYVDTRMFEYLYDTAKLQGTDIVKADFYRFSRGIHGTQKFLQPVANDIRFYHRIVIPQKENDCFRNIMNIWCGIYKREFLDCNNIYFHETPGASFQDNGFWFKTLCYCKRLYYLDIPLYMNRRDNLDSSVHNPGNIYCCNQEYKLIREFLRKNKRLEEKFLEGYMIKKYETYMFNIGRIRGEPLKKYLKDLSEEWKTDYENGDLTEEGFTPFEWNVITQIMREPDKAYEIFSEKKDKEEVNVKIQDLQYQIDEIRKSRSYKIGMLITFIPRKIREIRSKGEK